MDKKEVEVFIRKLNQSQVERMRRDEYDEYLDEDDLDGCERFRGGGEWSIELTIPKPILDLLPEDEKDNWWQVPWIIEGDDCHSEGLCWEEDGNAKTEFGVEDKDLETIDETCPLFCRRYYEFDDEQTKWWENLEKEYRDKIDLPFDEVLFRY